jgi:predicted lipoprotein with Yx(FWY)xxD motif
MALDLTSFDAALKEHYTDQRIQNMTYQDRPLLAMLSKKEDFGGRNLPVPIIFGNPQGRSATFATAQANKSDVQVEAFTITRKKDYGLASIDNETLEASKGDKNAFLEAAATQIDGVIDSVTDSLAISLYGSGSGARGQVSAEPSTNASTFNVTLSDANDVVKFEKGMTLVIYSAESGGSQRTSDGSDNEWVIAAVNRSTGVLTLTGTYDGSGDIAANDYIFVEGDRGSMISGLRAWLPDSAPSATAFFGVDRSVDTDRLGGIRYDGSSQPIEEALVDAAARLAREGARPDVCFLSFAKWAELEKALGSKVQYVDLKSSADVGFRGIMIHGPKGPIKVVADRACPNSRAFMLQMNTWKLNSLGAAPKILRTDSLTMLREATSDSVEVRVGYYAQLSCNAPGYNANIQLA